MPDYRYAQFCPLARAAEVVGERWTLLIVRELFSGPQRFSDLRRRLPGLSSSVLAERLGTLEEKAVVRRRTLSAPAASSVYELDEAGRALYPALRELILWGVRFLGVPQPGDHLEPDWVRLGLEVFARPTPTPARRIELWMPQTLPDQEPLRVCVVGGKEGVHVEDLQPVSEARPASEARLSAPPLVMLGLASGAVQLDHVLAEGLVQAEGDLDALRDLPALFDVPGAGDPSPDLPDSPETPNA